MKKITRLVVTDESGVDHTFEGDGFVTTLAAQEKSPSGGMAKVIGLQVTANLLVPKEN